MGSLFWEVMSFSGNWVGLEKDRQQMSKYEKKTKKIGQGLESLRWTDRADYGISYANLYP